VVGIATLIELVAVDGLKKKNLERNISTLKVDFKTKSLIGRY
jgi:dynactin complex subunit